MAAKRGIDLLIKYNSGTAQTPVWSEFAGMRSKSVRIGRQTVDVTTADSANLQRVLLDGGGVGMVDINASGVFDGGAAQEAAIDAANDQTDLELQITIPGVYTVEGAFKISDFTVEGNYDGEASYSMTFQSSGAYTLTAIT